MVQALVVEDDSQSLASLARLIKEEGFDVSTAGSLKEARERLETASPDVVVSDLMLPDGTGLDLVKDLDTGATDVVVMTGHASIETAVEALRLGVSDYLMKPVDVRRLKAVLAHVRRTRELREEIGTLREELVKLGRFGHFLGASPSIKRVYQLILRVAPTEATVLLTGESGTGKDLAAQTIHQFSKRKKAVYLPLNCGAVSPNLIESELFGHERGSFTGANRTHKGYFERANGGTLFLDEITEMPAELQVKLLRVLETGTFLRIGGDDSVSVNVRVLAATNRSPEEAIAEGKLREDLLYRLNVFPIHLPPLRERQGDVELLAEAFLHALNHAQGVEKKFGREAVKRLREHDWPGNVRELKNAVHRAFILADDVIGPEYLLGKSQPIDIAQAPLLTFKLGTTLHEIEKRLILATLESCGGDKKKTAEVLGLSLRTLYYRLNNYSLE